MMIQQKNINGKKAVLVALSATLLLAAHDTAKTYVPEVLEGPEFVFDRS